MNFEIGQEKLSFLYTIFMLTSYPILLLEERGFIYYRYPCYSVEL